MITLLYDRFRERAQQRLRHERAGHSLGATDLVHEALVRLWRGEELTKAANGNQLFRAFARAMRQTLIDHARRRTANKRGGNRVREELDDLVDDVCRRSGGQVEMLSEALDYLAGELPREATVLEMRFFGRYTLPEIAAALSVSLSTVERDSQFGLAWLRDFLAQEPTHAHS